jgi:RNA recognition motif-containing protein
MTSIFVAKLDFGVTNEQLKEAFSVYGKVHKATVAIHKETGKSRGFAFVEMANRDEALMAIKSLDGSKLNGREIAVKEAEKRDDNRSRPTNDERPGNHQPTADVRKTNPTLTRETSAPSSAFISPPSDLIKSDPKKKKETDKRKSWDDDKGQKKPKMNAYKKSGKNSRFFDDDEGEDDWEDYLAYKKRAELDEDEEDEMD